jgi:hypothetical protein
MMQEEEKLLRELMSKSEVKMPFPDFEDKLMERINREAQRSRSFLRDLKLSWFFFLVGTVLGIMITLFLTTLREPIYGIPPQRLLFIAESIFVVLLLTQLDKMIDLTKRKRVND